VVLALAAPAAARPVRVSLGGSGGVALQSDQYVLGPHATFEGLGLPFLDARVRVLGGIGPDYLTLHPAIHARLRLEIRSFRLYALGGGSLYAYRPRGGLAKFCDKATIDCSDVAIGFDLGAGAGWRWLEADVVVGTGDLPLWTFTAGASFRL
jgi:hypothetical protein